MNLYIIAIAAALSFAGGWTVNGWRHDALEKDRIEQVAKERVRQADKIDTAAAGHEADKAQIRTVTRVIIQEVERIVREEPFYAAPDAPACFTDDGLRILSDAIAGRAPAASEPSRAVPEPKRAR